jgi:hypothetical protein
MLASLTAAAMIFSDSTRPNTRCALKAATADRKRGTGTRLSAASLEFREKQSYRKRNRMAVLRHFLEAAAAAETAAASETQTEAKVPLSLNVNRPAVTIARNEQNVPPKPGTLFPQPQAQKKPDPGPAGLLFVGSVIKGESLNRQSGFQIPRNIPVFGGKTVPPPPKGWDSGPGLVVAFPESKTLFVTATQATVPADLISKGAKLKWVATVSEKSVQFGLGNSLAVDKTGNSVAFWNIRADATGLAKGVGLSLRKENKGKEISLGTLNAGLLHKPTCKPGQKPSHVADLVGGVGFQARVVAKDGEIMVRHGKHLMPILAWEASFYAAAKTVTELTSVVCDDKSILDRAGDALKNAAGVVSNALNSEEAKEFGAGVVSVVTGIGGFLLDRLLPRHAY